MSPSPASTGALAAQRRSPWSRQAFSAPPSPDVEVVLPVYNERATLEGSLRRLHGYLCARATFSWQITIADNASDDGTLALARRLSYELSRVEVIHLSQPGRGRALRSAWSQAGARVLCFMDRGLSADLEALAPLLAPCCPVTARSPSGHACAGVRGFAVWYDGS